MDEMDIFGGFNSNRRDRCGRFGNRGSFNPRRPFGKFDKKPQHQTFQSQVGQSIKTKVDVSNVRNLDIFKMNAQPINPHKKKAQDQRSLKTTHIPTQALTFKPQMQINSVNPNFASAYDQALGVVKDSPKHS